MKTQIGRFPFIAVLLVLVVVNCWGWSSWQRYNHRQITIDAITRQGSTITREEYPDIHKFYGNGDLYGLTIVNGSATEASHNQYITGAERHTWFGDQSRWEAAALAEYKALSFAACYNHLGYALHLKQDMFVPAHLTICYHGYPGSDELEWLARTNHGYETGSTGAWDKYVAADNHAWNYWLDDDTDDDDNNEDVADANDGTVVDGPDFPSDAWDIGHIWGTYGMGHWPDNTIPGMNHGGMESTTPNTGHDGVGDWFDETNTTADRLQMIHRLLQATLADTEEALKAYSISLPCVTYGAQLLREIWGGAGYRTTDKLGLKDTRIHISFWVEDNRKPNVNLKIQWSGNGRNGYVTDVDGVTYDGGNDSARVLSATDNGDTSCLPFRRRFDIIWNPMSDANLQSGRGYQMSISAKDFDNHWSDVATINFDVDKKETGGKVQKKNPNGQ